MQLLNQELFSLWLITADNFKTAMAQLELYEINFIFVVKTCKSLNIMPFMGDLLVFRHRKTP